MKQLLAIVIFSTLFLFIGVIYKGVTNYPKPAQKPENPQINSMLEKNRDATGDSTRDTSTNTGTSASRDPIYSDKYGKNLVRLSTQSLNYIYSDDYISLSQLVNPTWGIRINPHYTLTPDDRVIYKANLSNFMGDTSIYFRGKYAGSGFDIKLTNKDYMNKFFTHRDFRLSKETGYNTGKELGSNIPLTTVVNSIELPNEKRFVEYYLAGTEVNDYNDWESVALVFIKENETWYLYAILHNQWAV